MRRMVPENNVYAAGSPTATSTPNYSTNYDYGPISGPLLAMDNGYRGQTGSAMTATSGYASMTGYGPPSLMAAAPPSLPPYQPPPPPLGYRGHGTVRGMNGLSPPSPPNSQSTPLAVNENPSPPMRQMSPPGGGNGGHQSHHHVQLQQQPGQQPQHQQQLSIGSASNGPIGAQANLNNNQQGCGERVVWEFHNVSLNRVPGYGFGIAVSGGRDNPHFTNGDPAIAISDVLKAGPAEGKLQINDRVLSANGVSLENVTYETAVGVLRDSGPILHLVVKRRVVLPSTTPNEQAQAQTLKLTLTKARKKDDFGVVLGCKIYVKEVLPRSIADKEGGLKEGDVLTKINSNSTENMSLKEARKLVDGAKDKLHLVVRRERPLVLPGGPMASGILSSGNTYENQKECGQQMQAQAMSSPFIDISDARPNYSAQNLYVQPPTRGQHGHSSSLLSNSGIPIMSDDEHKSNLGPRGAGPSGGRPLSGNYEQQNMASGAIGSSGSLMAGGMPQDSEVPPPRPPLPRDPSVGANAGANQNAGANDFYQTRKEAYQQQHQQQQQDSSLNRRIKSSPTSPDPRFISFRKEGSVGIRLTGGNQVGIFVTAVQPGSPAFVQGLQPGDKLLKVNDMDMKGVTREEAVLFLLSLQDQVDLIVQYRAEEYEDILAHQKGDSFYIKTHFNYETPQKGEMSFRKGDVFHVVDTLHNGVVGSWQVYRIGRHNEETQKGTIPNKSRAEELATAQFNATKKDMSTDSVGSTKTSFFRRKRAARRSKSLCKDPFDDMLCNDTSVTKFPAYERVSLCHPGFTRPVVIFGPLADIARERLLKDSPDGFCSPQLESRAPESSSSSNSSKKLNSGIIRLSSIREIIDRGKHAVLDVTPNAVDKLNYAQLYPITIFIKAESKAQIKELRSRNGNSQHKSSRKLYDQCLKLEKHWSQIFTSTLTLTPGITDGAWYNKTRDIIDRQQSQPIWMSETKPDESLADDFLFPMASRMSYASSPGESDVENGGPHGRSQSVGARRLGGRTGSASPSRRMERSNSDPNLAPMPSVVPVGATTPPNATGSPIGNEDGSPTYSGPPPYSSGPYQPDYETRAELRRGSQGENKYGFAASSSPTRQYPPGLPNGNPSAGLYQHGRSASGDRLGPGNSMGGPTSLPAIQTNGILGSSAGAYDPYSLLPNKPPAPKMGVLSSDLAAGRPISNYPHPHHITTTGAQPGARSQSPPYGTTPSMTILNGRGSGAGPELPPKIDRSSKPSKPSATERLFGARGGSSTNGAPEENGYPGRPSPLMAHSPVLPRNGLSTSSKQSNYDTYDPYRLESATSDMGKSTTPPGSSSSIPSSHDPYKFTRSSAQPIKTSTLERHRGDDGQPKFASTDIKPVPPPKNGPYKPVPPPKPKTYRNAVGYPGTLQPQPSGNYSDNYSSMNYVSSSTGGSPDTNGSGGTTNGNYYAGTSGTLRNGYRNKDDYASDTYTYGNAKYPPRANGHPLGYASNDDDGNGFDSGHGSSLDRNYDSFGRNYKSAASSRSGTLDRDNGQYYLNVPPPKPMPLSVANNNNNDAPKSNGTLDHREHRGSAFELYKKPLEYTVR